jgi:protein-tyrosine-phosphatase
LEFKLNILLVCKYNRFRSKIAEAFFKKLTDHKVKSAGIIKGLPIDDEIYLCAEMFGLKLAKSIRTLDWDTLMWQDMIIIVSSNVPKKLFEDVRLVKEMRVWEIPDTIGRENRIEVIKLIENKVMRFDEGLQGN